MPITAATFIVGWLAIAGVPPFAGFWSKDEILLFSLAESPALYVVGLVTALLTAYYMTRQVIMVFFGEAHWQDAAAEHGAHGDIKPHESPRIMLLAAGRARRAVARRRAHPAAASWIPTSWQRLEHWLEPVSSSARPTSPAPWAYDDKYLLLVVAAVARRAGIVIGLAGVPAAPDQGRRADASSPTPGTTTKPSPTSWAGPAARRSRARPGSTPTSSTAPSTAPADAVRDTAGELRKGQSGFVRGYAAIIGLGVVVLLAWFVVVRGIL